MRMAVFDLDGTLANIDHRRPFVEGKKKDWNEFFDRCIEDKPVLPVIAMMHALMDTGWHVEIWSGRSDRVQDKTVAWLHHHGAFPDRLRMRAEGDYGPDEKLKESWLLDCIVKPSIIFDDRDKVVAMWRRNGIVCAQVAPGDF